VSGRAPCRSPSAMYRSVGKFAAFADQHAALRRVAMFSAALSTLYGLMEVLSVAPPRQPGAESASSDLVARRLGPGIEPANAVPDQALAPFLGHGLGHPVERQCGACRRSCRQGKITPSGRVNWRRNSHATRSAHQRAAVVKGGSHRSTFREVRAAGTNRDASARISFSGRAISS
jgi:hypothetical protein